MWFTHYKIPFLTISLSYDEIIAQNRTIRALPGGQSSYCPTGKPIKPLSNSATASSALPMSLIIPQNKSHNSLTRVSKIPSMSLKIPLLQATITSTRTDTRPSFRLLQRLMPREHGLERPLQPPAHRYSPLRNPLLTALRRLTFIRGKFIAGLSGNITKIPTASFRSGERTYSATCIADAISLNTYSSPLPIRQNHSFL